MARRIRKPSYLISRRHFAPVGGIDTSVGLRVRFTRTRVSSEGISFRDRLIKALQPKNGRRPPVPRSPQCGAHRRATAVAARRRRASRPSTIGRLPPAASESPPPPWEELARGPMSARPSVPALFVSGLRCRLQCGLQNCEEGHSDDRCAVVYPRPFVHSLEGDGTQTGATTMRDHDTRQLTIALTAIVIVWSIAAALTYASTVLIALTGSLPNYAVAWGR